MQESSVYKVTVLINFHKKHFIARLSYERAKLHVVMQYVKQYLAKACIPDDKLSNIWISGLKWDFVFTSLHFDVDPQYLATTAVAHLHCDIDAQISLHWDLRRYLTIEASLFVIMFNAAI